MADQAFIYEAIRTPRGKQRGGSLHSIKPVDLVSGLIDEVLSRHGGLDPADVNDVILGVVSPVGEEWHRRPRCLVALMAKTRMLKVWKTQMSEEHTCRLSISRILTPKYTILTTFYFNRLPQWH